MPKSSVAAATAAAEKLPEKRRIFLNLIFDTYNIKIKILRILNFKYLNFNM
jgi:hypothetical protein